MKILALDDEKPALDGLVEAIEEAVPDALIRPFRYADDALDYAKQSPPDIAFLDIHVGKDSGLDVAKKLKKINPDVNIIFTTGYSEYAMDAISLHASGYLMKPVEVEDIKKQIDNLIHPIKENFKTPFAKTFGNFEFFVNERPMKFSLSKSKEMLAYLVDREGASVTRKELAANIFEDKEYDLKLQNYITKIYNALVASLKEAGVEDLVLKEFNSYSVDLTKFKCDAYEYLKGSPSALNSFHGEYMKNYSWGEFSIDKFFK